MICKGSFFRRYGPQNGADINTGNWARPDGRTGQLDGLWKPIDTASSSKIVLRFEQKQVNIVCYMDKYGTTTLLVNAKQNNKMVLKCQKNV